jgi:toxin ParE1/3/4
MTRPLIYRAAQIRLAEIWDYTVEKWGEEQADKYLRELGDCMVELTSKRHLWRRVKDKR